MLNHLCQIEIKVSDIGRSRVFYQEVFGLKLVPADIHNYYILDVPKQCPFGISLLVQKQVEANRAVVMYFKVDSLEGIREKISASKYGSFKGERLVPGYGKAIFVEDPDGHRFGLFSALSHTTHG